MSFSIIAPSILAGVPLPVPVEVKEPTDFMKFMVKHYHAAREIDKLNFFLNTQEPGMIIEGGGRRYAGWANSYVANGRNKLRVHARHIPGYVSNLTDPIFGAIPYPFGPAVFGVNDGKFGVQSVIGPNGLLIPVKPSVPVSTDGKPLRSGLIMPFGSVGGPFPGMFGLRISRRDDTKSEAELFRENIGTIESYATKVKTMHDELLTAKGTKTLPTPINDRIAEFKISENNIKTIRDKALRECATKSDAGTCTKQMCEEAKAEHDRIEKLKTQLLADINSSP